MTQRNLIVETDRRGFLGLLFSAGAFVLGASDQLSAAPASGTAEQAAWSPNMWIGVETDGTVKIVAHRSEMGTGIRTVLPQVVAEEMEADWSRVHIEQALGNTRYGSQNTDGSCSIRDFVVIMQQAGATARVMLETAAANQWKVPLSEVRASNGRVVHAKTKRSVGFGELASAAAALPRPAGPVALKDPAQYRIVGKDVPMVDQKNILSGKGTFGVDAKMPNMLVALVERPPVYGSTVKAFDDTEAKKVPGVVATAQLEKFKEPHVFQQLGGVAVLANSTWAAMQGRRKLKVEWNESEHNSWDSTTEKQELLATVSKPGKVVRNVGDVDAALAAAKKTHEASYFVPMLSHAPMEPPAAVAEYKDGKVVTWAATQNPQAVQEAVAGAMGLKPTDVECHVTLLGGGFGRKSKPDYVVEAALLSKQTGRPVKVMFTREDDIRFDFYHAVAGMHFKAGLDDKGLPTAWLHRTAFPPIASTFVPGMEYGADFEMGMGWNELAYNIPNHRAENGAAKAHTRIGWMRSVAHIYHQFGILSFVDELAQLAKMDPVDYYLKLLGPDRNVDLRKDGVKPWNNGQTLEDHPISTARIRAVLETVADKSGWGKRRSSAGHGWGIVTHRSFLSYVACVAEVEIDSKGKLTIPNLHLAADCGQTFHPDRVRSQFEGAGVFGTSIAMMGEITAKNGRIVQSNFHDYPVARMPEAPKQVHVHMVASNAKAAGVGEPGVPPVPPAIANAIFAATGKRIRELPIRRAKLV
jgi:isoquinoline 1-oxidoreductase subunit beta